MRIRRTRRRGLTLIEMVLTFAIGMLVLLAVFMVLQSQYTATQAGRDAIREATLARNILTRVATDVTSSLGPVDPRWLNSQVIPTNGNIGINQIKNSGGGMIMATTVTAGGATSTTIATGSTGSKGSTGSSANASNSANSANSSSNSASGTSSTSSPPITPVPFNLGVKGDANWVVISGSRVPGGLVQNPQVTDGSVISSDLRSISIWFIPGTGLVRKELTNVTSDEAPTGEPDFPDPQVIAKEVKNIAFEYFDGVEWQTSWDGGQLGGSDGNTPIGPPSAIKITIMIGGGAEEGDRQYTHVVALPSSNAFTMAGQSGAGVTESLSGQGLIPAIQGGQQLSTTNLTNPPPSMQSGQSSSTGGTGQ
jgi:hypothetical protein